jgi:transposase-like protein
MLEYCHKPLPPGNAINFLKECEFRFNYGTLKQQLKTLKEWADA